MSGEIRACWTHLLARWSFDHPNVQAWPCVLCRAMNLISTGHSPVVVVIGSVYSTFWGCRLMKTTYHTTTGRDSDNPPPTTHYWESDGEDDESAHLLDSASCYVLNAWTQVALVAAVLAVGLYGFVDTCTLVNECHSSPDYSNTLCRPFVSNDALAACSMRACASDTRVSVSLLIASKLMAMKYTASEFRPYATWKTNLSDLNVLSVNASSRSTASNSFTRATPGGSHVSTAAATATASNLVSQTRLKALLIPGIIVPVEAHPNQQYEMYTQPTDADGEGGPRSYATALSTSPSNAAWNTTLLSLQLTKLLSSPCVVGMQRDLKRPDHCTPQIARPGGLVKTIMDQGASTVEGRACGVWKKATRQACFNCQSRYYAIDTGVKAEFDRLRDTVAWMRTGSGTTSKATVLLRQCDQLLSNGIEALVVSTRIANLALVHKDPSSTYATVGHVLDAIGNLAAYSCNSVVRVGLVSSAQQQQHYIRVDNMQIEAYNAMSNALQVVGVDDQSRLINVEIMRFIMTGTVDTQRVTKGDDNFNANLAYVLGESSRVSHCSDEARNNAPSMNALTRIVSSIVGRDVLLRVDDVARLESLTMLSRLICMLGHSAADGQSVGSALKDDAAQEVASAVVHTVSAMCVVTVASVLSGNTLMANAYSTPVLSENTVQSNTFQLSGRSHSLPPSARASSIISTLQTRTIVVGIGRIHRATKRRSTHLSSMLKSSHTHETEDEEGSAEPEGGPILGPPSLEEEEMAALSTLTDLPTTSTVQEDAIGSCASTVRFATPREVDHESFASLISAPLERRLSRDVETLQKVFGRVLDEKFVRETHGDIGVSEMLALSKETAVRIPGAQCGSRFALPSSCSQANNVITDDGFVLSVLKAARDNKRLSLQSLATGSNPCDEPFTHDANIANAYYRYPGNCIVVFLGLATASILNEAFDDEALYGRFTWIIAHELAHVSKVVTKWTEKLHSYFSEYTPSEYDEAIADVLGTIASAAAMGIYDVCPIIMQTAQMFCMSDQPNGAGISEILRFVSSATASAATASTHPSHDSRVGRICSTIRGAYMRGASNYTCAGACV
jgi:hypothetical protein